MKRKQKKNFVTKRTLINKIIERVLYSGELNESLIRYCIKKSRKENLKIWLHVAYEIAKNSPSSRKISENVIDALVKELSEIDLEKAFEIAQLGASRKRVEDLLCICKIKKYLIKPPQYSLSLLIK
jgi:hypothetical protein